MDRLNCHQIRSYQPSAEAAAMILSDVFERFAQDAPLSVMAQGVMENALNPQMLDLLFEGRSDFVVDAVRNAATA